MRTNDIPVTDAELDEFYGEWTPEPHSAACNAIRAIHYIDFNPETAQAIIATLAAKILSSPFTQEYTLAAETLDQAFQELEK